MSLSGEVAESSDALAKTIKALDEESFLKSLNSLPDPFENEAVKERLKAVSQAWKAKIETMKGREAAWEYTLYLIHLCPRLLDSLEFKWLKERFYGILMMRLWSSEADRDYWEALKRVKRDFTVTKPKTPEKKWIVARKYEDHRKAWILKEMSGTFNCLLDILGSKGGDQEEKIGELSRRIKVPSLIVELEIRRLGRIYEREIRSERDLITLPLMIISDLNGEEDADKRKKGRQFWEKIFKPVEKKMRLFRDSFMKEVSKETGLSPESIRKLIRKAAKESKGLFWS